MHLDTITGQKLWNVTNVTPPFAFLVLNPLFGDILKNIFLYSKVVDEKIYKYPIFLMLLLFIFFP